MANPDVSRYRSSIVIATGSIFGIFYFSLYILHLLILYFPTSPEAIVDTIAIAVFGLGAILWCLSSLTYRITTAIHGNDVGEWQRLEFAGTIILIYAASVPTAAFLFPAQPSLQVAYLCALTIVATGGLVDLLLSRVNAVSLHSRFVYHGVTLGLLSLAPTIQVLTTSPQDSSALAAAFGRLVVSNILAVTIYRLRLLDWMGIVSDWQPSLYALHLAQIHSLVAYSKEILHAITSAR